MQEVEIKVKPEIGFNEELLTQHIRNKYGENVTFQLLRRSIDARFKRIVINLRIGIYDSDKELSKQIEQRWTKKVLRDVTNQPEVIIVGAGPAGLFAAITAIEKGLKPVVLERGKDVRARRRDLAAINKQHVVHPDSNYCFGEGGAGTYSDGKLYTRATKRGDVRKVLEILVDHGANEEILVDAHPHIGTNKLPGIITNIRNTIKEYGGEVFFEKRVTDFILQEDTIKGVKCGDESYVGEGVILATGHSARDVFRILNKNNILIESKPFALGVRVEHQQALIDQIQYSSKERGDYLPAAAYTLKSQVKYQGKEQGVFSFCMCPGGFIVPSATSNNELVVNGMSPSRRDSKFANSGIVVTVNEGDFMRYSEYNELSGMYYQQEVEQKAWQAANKTQAAPAQRLLDFVNGKTSQSLLETSYQPGLVSMDMSTILPEKVAYVLREGFKQFGKRAKGYLTNEAQLIGIESRTSSPVKIPRDKETLEHVQVQRLFPSGEGAGYAGGIVSAAIDGSRCTESIFNCYFQ